MKVDIEANEIRDASIEKISLVTNGAIRTPFQILKMREIEQGTKTTGLTDRLAKIFGSADSKTNSVTAFYVKTDVARQWLPLIRKHGFTVSKDSAQIVGDVVILKQEGFDPDVEAPVIALNENVALQLGSVSKFFDAFPSSSNFIDNVAAGSFWPGLHSAMDTFSETVWNVLNEADSPEDAAAEVAKQTKAFSTHVNNLVAELPTAVFKMEQESLTKEFASTTLSDTSTETIVDNEETNMGNTKVIKEAAPGDLDGLLDEAPAADAALAKKDQEINDAVDNGGVTKGGDEGAPKTGGSPGSPVVDSTSDTGAVALDEGGVPVGFRKEERVVKVFEDGKQIEKHAYYYVNDTTKEEMFAGFFTKEADTNSDDYTPADRKMFEAMGIMAKGLVDIKDSIAKQDARIEAISKTADTAQETAESTVVLPATPDLDESLQTIAGRKVVQKDAGGEEDGEVVQLWKGVLPQLTRAAA